jgi:hypothetical protein
MGASQDTLLVKEMKFQNSLNHQNGKISIFLFHYTHPTMERAFNHDICMDLSVSLLTGKPLSLPHEGSEIPVKSDVWYTEDERFALKMSKCLDSPEAIRLLEEWTPEAANVGLHTIITQRVKDITEAVPEGSRLFVTSNCVFDKLPKFMQ